MTNTGKGAPVRPLFERHQRAGRPGDAPRLGPTAFGERDAAPRPRPLFAEPQEERLPGDPDEGLPASWAQAGAAPEEEGAEEAGFAQDPAHASAPEEEGAEDAPAPPPPPMRDPWADAYRAQAEAEAARDRYLQALRELQRVHAADFSALENDLGDVALEIARSILMRELQTDRLYVVRLVDAALHVTVEDEAASVLVSPQDLARVEHERPRLEVSRGGGLVRVSADPALHPGDCIVQVGRARIDARLGDRLERVRQALHGVVTETE